MPDLGLSDYAAAGAFEAVGIAARRRHEADRALKALIEAGRSEDFLREAVRLRKTIVVSGGTGTGKTTFLNALLKEAPPGERLILIEDTPEIQLSHRNAVGLVAVRGRLGEAQVSAADLLEAALRLRPDRIILGEIRGAEALSWLRAVGSGHPGSITTVHASSPEGAIDQLAMMAMLGGSGLGRAELAAHIRDAVDIVVQLGRENGARIVTDIACNLAEACGV
jgi:type IV secretion system protein VirB11